jgi:hypothetical protein
MVFTQVEVWRGIRITKEQIKELFHKYCGPEEMTGDFEKIILDNMLLNINDSLKEYGDHITIEEGTKCCNRDHSPQWFILGVKIASYKRLRFNIEDVPLENREIVMSFKRKNSACCGTLIEDEDRRCGDMIICDKCICKTTCGLHPVDDIAKKAVECTTWCFKCNQEHRDMKCQNLSDPLTIAKLIDDDIVQPFVYRLKLDEKEMKASIKNYYMVDDCLACG